MRACYRCVESALVTYQAIWWYRTHGTAWACSTLAFPIYCCCTTWTVLSLAGVFVRFRGSAARVVWRCIKFCLLRVSQHRVKCNHSIHTFEHLPHHLYAPCLRSMSALWLVISPSQTTIHSVVRLQYNYGSILFLFCAAGGFSNMLASCSPNRLTTTTDTAANNTVIH